MASLRSAEAHLRRLLALLTWRGGTAELARTFTPYVLASVLTLAASGLYISCEHIGSFGELSASAYGRTLLLKLGVVALALLAAVIVRRAFASGQSVCPRLVAEALTLLTVLGVTASLSDQAPPTHGSGTEHSGH